MLAVYPYSGGSQEPAHFIWGCAACIYQFIRKQQITQQRISLADGPAVPDAVFCRGLKFEVMPLIV